MSFRVQERTVYDVVDTEKETAGFTAHEAAITTCVTKDEADEVAAERSRYREQARKEP